MSFSLKMMRSFATPPQAEQRTTLRPTRGQPFIYCPVMSLPIGDVQVGDIVEVTAAYCQVSTRMRYNLMVSSALILTDQPLVDNIRGPAGWQGYPVIASPVGYNIDHNMHHYPVQRTGRLVVQSPLANAHIAFLVWTASTSYDGRSLLRVDQGRGRIEGAVYRDADPADLRSLLGL